MQKLIPERISHTEEAPMTATDMQLLKDKRNRQILFLLPPYLVLLCIAIYLWTAGVGGLHAGGKMKEDDEIDEEKAEMFWRVAPYVFSFFLLMATIYFARQFIQSIHPLMKDIRAGKKARIFYIPAKSAMPVFNKYYLSTPIYKNQQIEVSREDFENLPQSGVLCIETAIHSTHILGLLNGEKTIKYYQSGS